MVKFINFKYLIDIEDYKNSTLKNLLHPVKSLFTLKNLLRKKLVFENLNFTSSSDLAFSGLEHTNSIERPGKQSVIFSADAALTTLSLHLLLQADFQLYLLTLSLFPGNKTRLHRRCFHLMLIIKYSASIPAFVLLRLLSTRVFKTPSLGLIYILHQRKIYKGQSLSTIVLIG